MNKAKEKRIATMTFHIAHNYGAMLQAYALQRAISKLGFHCEVLDYRFPYIDQWSGIRSRHDLAQEYGFIGGNLRFLHRYVKGNYKNISVMRKKFDRFMRKDIKLSKKAYFTPESLCKALYDVVVLGSDQIWNPELTNGPALEYFGKYFNSEKTKLFSYAASCGTAEFKAEYKKEFLPLLQRFYALGIREKGLTDFLNNQWNLPATTVLDPVFLLEPKEWIELGKKAEIKLKKPYLLLYTFQTDDDIYDLARTIAKKSGLDIVAICYGKDERLNDILQLTECGPKDFISLFYNASFVCTSSFHGMAFSIIFEKDFYCMGHPLYSQRNKDLLELIGMEERMFFKNSEIETINKCDYFYASEKIKSEKEKAINFLRTAIDC